MKIDQRVNGICNEPNPVQGTKLERLCEDVLRRAKTMTADARKNLRDHLDEVIRGLDAAFEIISQALSRLKTRVKDLDLAAA